MRFVLILAHALAALLVRTERADACGPAVVVEGDASTVAAVTELLVERGIDTDPVGCPAVHARLQRRGAMIVVDEITSDGEDPVVRVVTELVAAATVIESWARTDVTSPLLAVHHVRRDEDAAPPAAGAAIIDVLPHVAPRGVQVFFALETSVADDRSSWLGTQLGVCVMLGPVCAAVRGRFASTSPEPSEKHIERRAIDVLFGGDIPLRFGSTTLAPGFAAGLGTVRSYAVMESIGSVTFGLRAEVHAVWSIPISARLSIDVAVTVDVTQVTDVETASSALADEPRVLARIGAGLRYGGL